MTEQGIEPVEENNGSEKIRIYSKRAILGFSLFFSPIFGGVLLYHNLVDVGNRKEANKILFVSIVLTVINILVISLMNSQTNAPIYILNGLGAALLTEFFYTKYFSNRTYEYKKIWKPLIISILITLPFLLAMIYAPVE